MSRADCRGVVLSSDGETCANCGRRARYEPQFGKVVHVRGRVKGKSPWKRDMVMPRDTTNGSSGPRPPASAGVVVFRSSPRPARYLERCPDCDAVLDNIRGVRRCPWTTSRRQVFVDGVMACGWPRGEKPPAAAS